MWDILPTEYIDYIELEIVEVQTYSNLEVE